MKKEVLYVSTVVQQIELCFEYFYESIREHNEPVIALFELVKMGCKLKEYSTLIY